MKKIFCFLVIISVESSLFGQGWVRQTSGTLRNLRDVWFIHPTSGTGWVVGDSGTILGTRNGGRNWTPQNSGTNFHLYGVGWTYFVVWKEWATAVGGIGNGIIIHTTNRGDTWSVRASTPSIIYCVSYTDSLYALAAGGAGSIWKTTDGGFNWTFLASPLREVWFGVWYASRVKGWVCGTNGAIMRTTDGGTTWRTQSSGTTNTLRGICFRDTLFGLVVGDSGLILRTTDAGTNWTQISSGVIDNLYGVHTSPFARPIAVGANGRILKSSDGGLSWFPELSGTNKDLHGVWSWFDMPGLWAWAVGDSGTILYQWIPNGVEKNEFESLQVKKLESFEIFPNPATRVANLRFQISDSRLESFNLQSSNLSIFQSSISIKIYDVTGRLVRQIPLTLKTDTEVAWDLRDDSGKKVSSGVYFIQLRVQGVKGLSGQEKTQTRRVLVIR